LYITRLTNRSIKHRTRQLRHRISPYYQVMLMPPPLLLLLLPPLLLLQLLLPLLLPLLLLLLADLQDILDTAFQQQPFTAAAVCEAAIRGAARHNQMHAGAIRLFAALATAAANEAGPQQNISSSDVVTLLQSSSSSRTMVVAAAHDDSLRDALLLQFGLITTQLKYATSSVDGSNVISALIQHVGPSCKSAVKLSKLIEAAVNMDSNDAIGVAGTNISINGSSLANSKGEDDVNNAPDRLKLLTPWLALAGRCLYFAGAQLLVAMESNAAAAPPNLTAAALDVVQDVLAAVFRCSVVTGAQVHQLQVLQPEGAILHGTMESAHPVLEQLLDLCEAATSALHLSLQKWKAANLIVAQAMRANGGGSGLVVGRQLQTQLRACLGQQAATQIRDAGVAVMSEFPVKLCCNNPGCSSMGKVGELLLGQSCSSCKVAKYCSRERQTTHWKMWHKGLCKRVKEEAAAAAAAGTGGGGSSSSSNNKQGKEASAASAAAAGEGGSSISSSSSNRQVKQEAAAATAAAGNGTAQPQSEDEVFYDCAFPR
jgi:hypothetical protein